MPEIEPVKTIQPHMEYSEKKSHEIEHFESASKTEQVEVGVADRNRNVSAKYVDPPFIAMTYTEVQNPESPPGTVEGSTVQHLRLFLRRTWIQRQDRPIPTSGCPCSESE
jgi:hypothetical protein